MDPLPIILNLRGQHTVVAGGGQVAGREVSSLARVEAMVGVVACEIYSALVS